MRTGKPVNQLLGFGKTTDEQLQSFTNEQGNINIGELNENKEINGRGIKIYSSGDIIIAYWANGDDAPGHLISIGRDGEFWVGEGTQVLMVK